MTNGEIDEEARPFALFLPFGRNWPGVPKANQNGRGDDMETAKVDIRKLQLLNDRIAQTIDALNQVRLSVHGVQYPGVYGQMGGGIPQQNPWQQAQQTPWQQPGMGMPFGQQGQQGPGLSHTGYGFSPGFPQVFGGQQGIPQQAYGQGYGQPFMPFQQGGGLGHTSFDPGIQQHLAGQVDPYGINRWAQTFPFAFWQ
jgi:hypothetical protein